MFSRSLTRQFRVLIKPYLLVGDFEVESDAEEYMKSIVNIEQKHLEQGRIKPQKSLAEAVVDR